jgi:ABC-type branched-subunit amino acid transport system substrate-binding protein
VRGAPEIYYPIGTRHYVRLTSPDKLMGAALAKLAKQLGLRRVFVFQDGDVYWKTVLVDPFRQTARRVGVRIAGSATFSPEQRRFDALADRVARAGADGVLLDGALYPGTGTLQLLKAVRGRLGPNVPIMVGYGFASIRTADLFAQAGPGLRGVYAATLDPPRTALPLTVAARRISRTVDATQPGVLEAAQATELVLGAIARSDGTRASVLAELRASTVRNDILGTFHFDDKGDMTPGWVPIVRFTGPADDTAAHLAGAVVDRVVQLPPSVTD